MALTVTVAESDDFPDLIIGLKLCHEKQFCSEFQRKTITAWKCATDPFVTIKLEPGLVVENVVNVTMAERTQK